MPDNSGVKGRRHSAQALRLDGFPSRNPGANSRSARNRPRARSISRGREGPEPTKQKPAWKRRAVHFRREPGKLIAWQDRASPTSPISQAPFCWPQAKCAQSQPPSGRVAAATPEASFLPNRRRPVRRLPSPAQPQHRWLVTCLARYADRDGKCWPSMRQLAATPGCRLSTVCRRLVEMADLNVFQRDPQRRRALRLPAGRSLPPALAGALAVFQV